MQNYDYLAHAQESLKPTFLILMLVEYGWRTMGDYEFDVDVRIVG